MSLWMIAAMFLLGGLVIGMTVYLETHQRLVVTPTPDIFNMMLFAVPMCLLFYFGIFASYLLVLHREHRAFP